MIMCICVLYMQIYDENIYKKYSFNICCICELNCSILANYAYTFRKNNI